MDLLETLFGEPEDIDPEQLETETTKTLHQQATEAEEAAMKAKHGPLPTNGVTRITITSVPIPIEFGIPEANLPEMENIKAPSTKNPTKKVTHFYYRCQLCSHNSQDKSSMMTHTRRCLQIKLVCKLCRKEYESTEGIENHINETHEGHYDL